MLIRLIIYLRAASRTRVPKSWRSVHSLRIIAVLVLGTLACIGRYWYTGGTAIERMDPFSNPVAASDDPEVRRLSYALVHGMYLKLLVWPSFLCYDYSMDAVPLVRSLSDRCTCACAVGRGSIQLQGSTYTPSPKHQEAKNTSQIETVWNAIKQCL